MKCYFCKFTPSHGGSFLRHCCPIRLEKAVWLGHYLAMQKCVCYAALVAFAATLLSSCEQKKKDNNLPKPPPSPPEKVYKPFVPEPEPPPPPPPPPQTFFEVNNKNLDKLLRTQNKLVILVLAPAWCPHSNGFVSMAGNLVAEYKGKVYLLKLDPDAYPELAARYALQAVPKVIFFSASKPLGEFVGACTSSRLQQEIAKYLPAVEPAPVTQEGANQP